MLKWLKKSFWLPVKGQVARQATTASIEQIEQGTRSRLSSQYGEMSVEELEGQIAAIEQMPEDERLAEIGYYGFVSPAEMAEMMRAELQRRRT